MFILACIALKYGPDCCLLVVFMPREFRAEECRLVVVFMTTVAAVHIP